MTINHSFLLGLLGLFQVSITWAICPPQDQTHSPAIRPIASKLYNFENQRLLGLDGGRVKASMQLPDVIHLAGKAVVAPHWALQVDWSAYANRHGGVGLVNVYFDGDQQLCRLEVKKFKDQFVEKYLLGWDERLSGASFDFEDAWRMATAKDVVLDAVQLFEYDQQGDLVGARHYELDDSHKMVLHDHRCYFRDAKARLVGVAAVARSCPAQIPADLSPRFVYSPEGQLQRQITKYQNTLDDGNGPVVVATFDIMVYHNEGESAFYTQDKSGRPYRKPVNRVWSKNWFMSEGPELAVAADEQLPSDKIVLAMGNVPWSIARLENGAEPYQGDSWLMYLQELVLKGVTDTAGTVNLNSKQRAMLWDLVSKEPGRYFLSNPTGQYIRLYPKVDDAIFAACASMNEEAAALCK